MKHLLDRIEARQQLIRETAGHLREQIALLTEQLTAAERTLERLDITRATMLELAAEDGIEPPEPLPPATAKSSPPSNRPDTGSAQRKSAKSWASAPNLGTPRASAPSSNAWSTATSSPNPNPACSPPHSPHRPPRTPDST
jgi:hypothetical protein